MPPLVKICGNTNINDAIICLEQGADMLGFIFYDKSPRFIDPQKAGDIISVLKKDFTFESVAVFVNPQKEFVDNVITTTHIDMLQFHGEESLSFIKNFSKKTIKAFRIKDNADILKCDEYNSADYFLFDAFSNYSYGGTGKVFNWNMLLDFNYHDRLFLSGGISADNVKEAISKVKPYAVDLTSGVEKSPGVKDIKKIKEFFSAIKSLKK